MAEEAYFRDILREPGHRYKRVVLALCLILIGISLYPNLDFSQLSLFGIKPAPSDIHGKLIVFSVLWLLLAYHAAFQAYHSYEDWKDWCWAVLPEEIGGPPAYPRLGMYFRVRPDDKITQRRLNQAAENVRWESKRAGGMHQWVLHFKPTGEAKEQSARSFHLPTGAVDSVRRRVLMFLIADCGLTILLFVVAFAATLWSWT